ncbi:MAG: guanylate kinase [Clostridiales bacterium]|nr:guanylate kinase [Clostridiales bacterium]
MRSAGSLIVISAPSGSGKGTVIGEFRKSNANVELSVSYSSRAPRNGEIEGVHYFFVSEDRFKDMIRQSSFIEWDEYCGHYYGTSEEFVSSRLGAGKDVIFDITIKGAFAIKRQHPDAILVFIVPPSFDELRNRLEMRGTESAEIIEGRLAAAKAEIQQLGRFDYCIVNDVVESAAARLGAIVAAEKCRIRSPEQAAGIISERMGGAGAQAADGR